MSKTDLMTALEPFAVLANDYMTDAVNIDDDSPMVGRLVRRPGEEAEPPSVTFRDFRNAHLAFKLAGGFGGAIPQPSAGPVTSYQAAYACLWRLESDRPEIHQVRRTLLGIIGGMGSPGQRAAIQWVLDTFGEPVVISFGVDTEDHAKLAERNA